VAPSTVDQTVLSGRISISLIDFGAFLVDFDRVSFHFVLVFLVQTGAVISAL
jgi:hypothetical protein